MTEFRRLSKDSMREVSEDEENHIEKIFSREEQKPLKSAMK